MNNKDFIEQKDMLLKSIENNTKEHWKNYYKDVPIECIYEDLVLDINEIKILTEENKKYKEAIDKAINDLEIIIEIVKEQPLGSVWIINRLEANKSILKEVE